jgi:hypothetical protein
MGVGKMLPQFEQWLLSHTKGLHIRTQYGDTIYTAILVRLNGSAHLLTAGHCLEELNNARARGIKIEAAHVFSLDSTSAFSLIDIETTQLHFIHEPNGIDIGLISLRPWYENQLKDELFLEEAHFMGVPSSCTGYILIGFPAEFELFGQTDIKLNPAYVSVTPTSKPDELPETNPPRFFGLIPPTVDFSIKGMSGGPIMAFLHDDEKSEIRYWVVALQSGWLKPANLICGTNLSTCLPILMDQIKSNQTLPRI